MNILKVLKGMLLCALISCLGLIMLISVIPFETDCICPGNLNSANLNAHNFFSRNERHDKLKHKLAVLVPFRERFEELLLFVPHLTIFLENQYVDHHIFILNQVDRYRFNRASLINVGFLFVNKEFDYIAMHDVDLLPLNNNLKYEYPEKGPLHIASPTLHPKYHYDRFVGGILLIKREDFLLVNGMSNNYWGWGLEDDEFYVRMKDAKLKLTRPKNITTGINDTFRHIHNRNHRKRDSQKCFNQKEITRKRDKQTGLYTVQYNITKINKLYIDGAPITIVNIFLNCNIKQTPWCDCNNLAAASLAN